VRSDDGRSCVRTDVFLARNEVVMIGRTIANFQIQELLGRGGMGEVYLAEDLRLERKVALKILPDEFASDDSRRKRFLAEAKTASTLNHPNITHIYEVGQADGVHFIAMELVEGSALDNRMSAGTVGLDEIVDIGVQLADALVEAHAVGIIHRDIKPANVMLTPRGQLKVLDFGLAKLRPDWGGDEHEHTTQTLTQPGIVLGTVRYMSPEQALGKDIDTRSDLFSVGVVLYELVTGRAPFAGATATETITNIVHIDPEPIPSLNPDAPTELERIIRKCLEKDPDRRYQGARDLEVDLRNLQRDRASGATVTATTAPPRIRRSAMVAAGVAALVAGAILSGSLINARSSRIDSVAVLPFENGTGDPDAEYLCDGLTESLINSLSRVPELKVISRRSAFTFKDSQEDPPTIGRRLDVEALVMGRVVQRADQLLVTAELVNVRDNSQLWGGRYNRTLADVVAIEQDLARTITQTLKVQLSSATKTQLDRRYQVDPEAHRLYLQGRQFVVGSSREMNKAVDYLQQAIDQDPGFALARAELGRAFVLQAYHSVMERDEALDRARQAVSKALEIDDQLAEAHAVSAEIKYLFDWDWAGADRDLMRAVELNPGSDTVRLIYADFLASMGRFDEAIAQSEKAKELDPLSPAAAHMLAFSLMGTRDYERAAAEFRAALDLNPNWTWGYIKLSKTLADDGQCQEALQMTAEAEAQLHGGSTPLARTWLGYTYAKCGQLDRAHDALRELDAMAAEQYVDPGCYAELYAAIGTMDQVLDALERSVADRSPDAIYLPVIPDYFLPELAEEPRYQALLERMNLPTNSLRNTGG
jgi:uncharacterized protein (TIGR02996 family)